MSDMEFEQGDFVSAWEHFRMVGYFEGRVHILIKIDRDWYLATLPDLAKAVQTD